ncbi:MAG: ribosome small subunit-dependent GTPase A [Bacillota bacterium]|nr:ribosome small subunit-dependent GTPase A [Bacillota bacterium]
MDTNLINLGFNEKYKQEASCYEGLFPARITAQHKNLYRAATMKGEVTAGAAGRLRHNATCPADFPAVGDFVMLDRERDENGPAVIHAVLGRKSVFERKAAGTANEVQVVAANIDTAFICMALNRDFNLRRLERYLAIAWSGGALPVVVLTKADLCEDVEEKLSVTEAVAPGVDILVTSGLTADGWTELKKYVAYGETVAFIGSSGVGKSTLINRLMGDEILETGKTRSDDKGRHVTTRRELILTPAGGAVIDTPGMRELGVDSVDLASSFADIDELAEKCRFRDCSHDREPGCAVRKAIGEGLLDEKRLENYRKLKKEARYEGLNSREIEKEKSNEMFSGFDGVKNFRDYIKHKSKHSR